MPEAKNTFIQSKMNKDMDGRILPNGQYRDGENVQISRSEGDDVGALETVLGNVKITDFGLSGKNLKAIGSYFDDTTNKVFLFLTNYTDSSPNQLDNDCIGADGVNCYIVCYNIQTQLASILVEGNFLNFSQTHPVLGVSLLENLLFWTDNRNQPRKIDVTLAVSNYYTTEDQISVAKYYPYTAPLLLKYIGDNGPNAIKWESTMTDTTSKYLPIHTAATCVGELQGSGGTYLLDGHYTNIMPNTPGLVGDPNGCLVTGEGIPANTTVQTINTAGLQTEITFNPPVSPTIEDGTILYFQFQNPEYLINWPGDPEYLKEKFVRFSYRFKFDNNEYSLIAPFTQIAFVPQQDGYFIGDKAIQNITIPGDQSVTVNPDLFGQEAETFDSTVVPFMQNKVTNVEVCLISPTQGNKQEHINWSQVNKVLKVVEVDILIKEASTNNVYVVETLGLSDLKNINDKYLYYDYQSKKPWRVLPTNQVTRVSDVVPLRALAQEVSGNRVIYGNYIEKNASPERLSYHLSVSQKPSLPEWFDSDSNNEELYVRKEYQNHTLKQNRTYQVGVVLADRYGRKSNVILSELIDEDDGGKKNSTIFHNYANSNSLVIYDKNQIPGDPADTWPGDLLSIVWTNVIPKLKTQDGYPGVYSINDGSLSNILVNEDLTSQLPVSSSCSFEINGNSGGNATISVITDANGDVFEVTVLNTNKSWINGEGFVVDWNTAPFCPGWGSFLSFRGNALCPVDNPLGWYSYNIVVKQTEQEYYNVYMPNALAGYPCNQNVDGKVDPTFGETPKMIYPVGQQDVTSHLPLFGDNINKVPRDLNEVGPEQKSFRSSERLFHRVESILFKDNNDIIQYSSQPYTPNPTGDKVVTIANMARLDLGNLVTNPAYPILPNLIYKANTDPFIARISTEKRFGIIANSTINGCISTETKIDPNTNEVLIDVNNTEYASGPTLSVSETKPVESLLDIFWETSSSGLISDLNFKIENEDNTAPAGLSPVSISWSEGDPYGASISGQFSALGPTGLSLVGDCEIELVDVTRGDFVPCIDQFELVQLGFGEVELKIAPASATNPGFLHWQDQTKNEYVFKFKITSISTGAIAFDEITGYVSNRPPVELLEATNGDIISWTDVKEKICVRGDLTTQNQRETAQTMSLKAEEGQQKYGLNYREDNIPWRNYVDPESGSPNTQVNFGKIAPTTEKYINAAPFSTDTSPCCTDSNMDNGDIRQSGMYDFGWFGGPTLPGTQGQKNGDDKFFNTWYNPGNNTLNSCGYSQKIYAPDPSIYNTNNNYYPTSSSNADDREKMPKYWRGANDFGAQPDIKWSSSILQETAFTKDVETNSGVSEWDGTFAVKNGEYGSAPSESWPTINGSLSGIGTAIEIQWSIPRMYQVSMMIPHGNSIDKEGSNGVDIMSCFGVPALQKFPFDFPEYWWMPSRTAFPISLTIGTTGSKYFDVQPAGEVIFGLIPEATIDALSISDRNAILKYLPKGPIYWDSSSESTRDGFQGDTQLDPENKIGESIVGAKQNTYQDTSGQTYPHHYWPDINALLQNDAAYNTFRNTSALADAPDFMKLRDGANTFYQFNNLHASYFNRWICGTSDTVGGVPYFANAAKNIGWWKPNLNETLNALGHLFYIGGISSGPVAVGSSISQQTFFVNPQPLPPGYASAKATLHAGTPNSVGVDWDGPNDFGIGLPGGRYVVTLRATDVAGDGAFVEWDVPIYLPWWSTRTNSPLRMET